MQEENQKQLKLYPNPASNTLIIQGEWATQTQVSIIDMNGKQLPVNWKKSTNFISVYVSALAEGVYFVKVQTADDLLVRKFIKH